MNRFCVCNWIECFLYVWKEEELCVCFLLTMSFYKNVKICPPLTRLCRKTTKLKFNRWSFSFLVSFRYFFEKWNLNQQIWFSNECHRLFKLIIYCRRTPLRLVHNKSYALNYKNLMLLNTRLEWHKYRQYLEFILGIRCVLH